MVKYQLNDQDYRSYGMNAEIFSCISLDTLVWTSVKSVSCNCFAVGA